MTGSAQLYSILSFLSFYLIYITSKSIFSFFGVILFIASGIALLAYFESKFRSKKSDIISVVFYILFTAFFLVLPKLNSVIANSGISINAANLQGYWMPVYVIIIFIPVYFLYKNRQHNSPMYIPVLLAAFIPLAVTGLALLLLDGFRNYSINTIANIIQVSVIDYITQIKNTAGNQLPEVYGDILSYATLNKMQIAKQIVYLSPSWIASSFILIIYMADRFKPLIKDNALVLREFRIPDALVWVLIAGGFLILVPNEVVKFVSYNILIIFGILYFFQGMQITNRILDRFQVSFFFRMLLFMFIFIDFVMFAVIIIMIGLFSIWYKPKWLYQEDNSDNKGDNNGNNS